MGFGDFSRICLLLSIKNLQIKVRKEWDDQGT